MKENKYCLIGEHMNIIDLFRRHGWQRVDQKEADIIVYPGGLDINPILYGENAHPSTQFNDKTDQTWLSQYGHMRSPTKLKIGICRGAQFLNVMNFGKLWQDVDEHKKNHETIYVAKNGDRMIFETTSTHHQMMRPHPGHAWMWAYALEAKYRDDGNHSKEKSTMSDGPDPEVVWYPGSCSLCFQPHPEYYHQSSEKLFWLCVNRAMYEWNLIKPKATQEHRVVI